MKALFSLLSSAALALSATLTAAPLPSEDVIENLLTARTPDSFAAAYAKATEAALPQQVLLEARFLYLVDQQDHTALAALSSELLAITPTFDPAISSIFSLKEDWMAIVHYTQALDALEKKQPDLFKKHITEAFWLSPRQASAFAPHIDQLRLDQAMQNLTLPNSLQLPRLLKKESTSLIDGKSAATLLYFWSPWSREFAESLEEFKFLSSETKKHNIHLIAVLVEKSSEVETDAKKLIHEEKLLDLATWCTDTTALELSGSLRIQSAPTAVLVSPKGQILSNSHPSEAKLWNALTKIAPSFHRNQPSPAE